MSPSPHTALVVGLGGNLGGQAAVAARFCAVTEKLGALWGQARVSGNFVTAPVGPVQDQPDFINAVAAFWPEAYPTPEDALALLQAIEAEHGRSRTIVGGARTIDLDLLLHAGETRDGPGLHLPHPRMAARAFVLEPLKELFGETFQWDSKTPEVGELLLRPGVAAQRCTKLQA